jgi:hypothetical protein
MGRAKRADGGGMVFHVLNRANARATIFEKPEDDAAFERVLQEGRDRVEMRVLSYAVHDDEYFLTVCRYVERNALRANVVKRAEDGMGSSLGHRQQRKEFAKSVLSEWPVSCPRQWRQHVNQPQSDAKLEALRRSVDRGSPFGDSDWAKRIVKRLAWRPQFAHADVPSWSQARQTVSDTFARHQDLQNLPGQLPPGVWSDPCSVRKGKEAHPVNGF